MLKLKPEFIIVNHVLHFLEVAINSPNTNEVYKLVYLCRQITNQHPERMHYLYIFIYIYIPIIGGSKLELFYIFY